MHDLCHPLRIDVPRGGAKILSVDLFPSLPENGEAGTWPMVDVSDDQFRPFSSLVVAFDEESDKDEQHYEQAVIVFHIAEKVQTDAGHWSFVMGGIQYDLNHGDVRHEMNTSVSPDGQTMTMTVSKVINLKDNDKDKDSHAEEQVDFSYLAMYRERKSGECRIYSSSDPSIRIGRPPAP